MQVPEYFDFDLELTAAPEGRYLARVLSSPKGEASAVVSMPATGSDLENVILKLGRTRAGLRSLSSPEARLARAFGTSLYDAVFAGEVGTTFRRSVDEAQARGKGLRVKLHLAAAPELSEIPWEYLYATGLGRFLVLSGKTPVVRYLDLPSGVTALTVAPPLRVLLVVSGPVDLAPIDHSKEAELLGEALRELVEKGLVRIDPLTRPTLAELRRALRRTDYHVLHFIGHGAYDPDRGDGVLAFEDEHQRSHRVYGSDLGTLLGDHPTLRLAVLNACEGARQSPTDPFSGVAQSLVRQGLPAVVAMQFEITDAAAIVFAQEFYAAIADGYPVDAALAQARMAVFSHDSDVEWGTPVLFLRARDGRVFDITQSPPAPSSAAPPAPPPALPPPTVAPPAHALPQPLPPDTEAKPPGDTGVVPPPDTEVVPPLDTEIVAESVPAEPAVPGPTDGTGTSSQPGSRHRWVYAAVATLLLLVGVVGGRIWYVTAGPGSARAVPVVVGLPVAAAEQALREVNLLPEISRRFDPSIPVDVVLTSDSAAGTTLSSGSTVRLTVSSGPTVMTVPDLAGLTREDAEARLVAAGLGLGSVGESAHDSVPAGLVISQTPAATTTVAQGSAVAIVVSKGPTTTQVTVPDVTGKPVDTAEAALRAAGFKVARGTAVYSSTVPEGSVVSQNPKGVAAAKGSTVTIVLSKGAELVVVPNVVGKSQTEAKATLEAAGFKVATKPQFSSTVAAGTVIVQDPAANSKAAKGSSVTLTVTTNIVIATPTFTAIVPTPTSP